MNKIPLTLMILLLLVVKIQAQSNVGINDDNSSPGSSAMLDVKSVSKGMLIPRIALDTTTSASPVTSPAESLLIYNTATSKDVSPGYYYWNGISKWVRLTASSDPPIAAVPVSKSASCTLLKTENMVFASGDITLTLPTVTGTDDGLEISVKNVGTYTDLIVVVPESGKLIDINTSSSLTRWHGRTFVARGSDWIIKEKEMQTDNSLEVSAIGSFTTIPEVVAFLNAHMTEQTVVNIGPGTYALTESVTIDLPKPIVFSGPGYGGATIITSPNNGATAFNIISECSFKMLKFVTGTTAGIGFNYSGTGITYRFKDSDLDGFTKAIVLSGSGDLGLLDVSFRNCTSAAVEIASGTANVIYKSSECDFRNCAKGINLLSFGTDSEINITNSIFYNTSGQVGIDYTPPATAPYYRTIVIQNNGFNNIGTFATGFDFTNVRDANIVIENNPGVKSQRPYSKVNLLNNTTGTTITVANTWYKAAFTNTSNYKSKWTVGNNRITYQSTNIMDVVAFISGTISCNTNNATVSIGIVQDGSSGTRYGTTIIKTGASNVPVTFSTNVFLADVPKDRYFEIWVTSNATDVITLTSLNWWTDTR